MVVAWRIVKARYRETAFDGEATSIAGSRWTSVGLAVVYAAESLSLAALETLVHLNQVAKPPFLAFRCEFADELVDRVELRHLPPDWQHTPAPPELRLDIGNGWVRKGQTPVLSVPSALVPQERNYILNPAHPAFAGIAVGEPEPFVFDIRLLNRYNPAP